MEAACAALVERVRGHKGHSSRSSARWGSSSLGSGSKRWGSSSSNSSSSSSSMARDAPGGQRLRLHGGRMVGDDVSAQEGLRRGMTGIQEQQQQQQEEEVEEGEEEEEQQQQQQQEGGLWASVQDSSNRSTTSTSSNSRDVSQVGHSHLSDGESVSPLAALMVVWSAAQLQHNDKELFGALVKVRGEDTRQPERPGKGGEGKGRVAGGRW